MKHYLSRIGRDDYIAIRCLHSFINDVITTKARRTEFPVSAIDILMDANTKIHNVIAIIYRNLDAKMQQVVQSDSDKYQTMVTTTAEAEKMHKSWLQMRDNVQLTKQEWEDVCEFLLGECERCKKTKQENVEKCKWKELFLKFDVPYVDEKAVCPYKQK